MAFLNFKYMHDGTHVHYVHLCLSAGWPSRQFTSQTESLEGSSGFSQLAGLLVYLSTEAVVFLEFPCAFCQISVLYLIKYFLAFLCSYIFFLISRLWKYTMQGSYSKQRGNKDPVYWDTLSLMKKKENPGIWFFHVFVVCLKLGLGDMRLHSLAVFCDLLIEERLWEYGILPVFYLFSIISLG